MMTERDDEVWHEVGGKEEEEESFCGFLSCYYVPDLNPLIDFIL